MAEPPKGSDKKYFDVAPPKPISAPLINTQKRRILSKTTPIESTNTDVNEAVEQKTNHTDTLIDQAEVAHEQVSTVSHPDFNIPVKTHKEVSPKKEDGKETPETEPEVEVPSVDPLPGTAEIKEPKTIEQVKAIETTPQPTKPDDETVEEAVSETTKDSEAAKDDTKKTDEVVQDPETDKPVINLPEDDNQADQSSEQAQDSDDNDAKPEEETLTAVPEKFVATDSVPDPGQQKTEELKENMQEPKVYDTKEYYVPIGKSHHSHGGIKGAFVFGVICAAIVLAAALYFMYMLDK